MSKTLFPFLFVATEKIITVMDGDIRRQFTNEHPDFNAVKEGLRLRDVERLRDIFTRGSWAVPDFSNGMFKIDPKGEKMVDSETGVEVGPALCKRILHWAKEGLPFEPLLAFHRNIQMNPSPISVENLFSFLEANHVPITADGCFMGYKKVTRKDDGNLWDSHSSTIKNNIGTRVEIPREGVDPDPNQTCSRGLHVGAWQYVSGFSGNVTVAVKVHPRDVVAVPRDYNSQKMRTCGYDVVREIGEQIQSEMADHTAPEGESLEVPRFEDMTAAQIKVLVSEKYGVKIDIDNKNKKAIVKKAYSIAAPTAAATE